MGTLRAVPKFQPSSFVAVNLASGKRPTQEEDGRSLKLRIGQYTVEVGPDVDWALFDRLLGHLERRVC